MYQDTEGEKVCFRNVETDVGCEEHPGCRNINEEDDVNGRHNRYY